MMFAFAACSDDGGSDEPAKPTSYTITFNPNGGLIAIVEPQVVTAGEVSLTPAVTLGLIYDGHIFKGWASTSNAINIEYADGGKIYITKNITLYAIWESVPDGSFVVTFNTNGGSAIPQQQVASGEKAIKPADPTKEGYIFAGWYTNSSFTTTFNFSTETITANITLYAKWTATSTSQAEPKYYVYFDTANLADKISDIEKKPGEQFTESDLPTPSNIKAGYNFAGWYFDSKYTQAFTAFTLTTANESRRLYAKFTDASGNDVTVYTISYVNDAPDADNSPSTTTGYVTSVNEHTGLGTTRGRDGYLFDGWFYDDAYTQPVSVGDELTSDVTFYAKWTAIKDISASNTTQSFANRTYSELSPAKWYIRSGEKNEATGDYDYTEISEFINSSEKTVDYFTDDGIQKIGNAVIWQHGRSAIRMTVEANNTLKTDSRGLYILSSGNGAPLPLGTKTVSDITAFYAFAMVTASEKGTAVAHVWNSPSKSITDESHCVAAMIDSKGNVIDAKAIEDKDGTSRTLYTLSGEVEAGNVYLVFSRNGDAGGGMRIQDMGVYADSTVSYSSDWKAVASKTAKGGLITADIDITGDGITRGREGYFFGGWFYDKNYEEPVLRGHRISKDVTFYAKWISVKEIMPGSGAVELWDAPISSSDWYEQSYDANNNEVYTSVSSFSFKPNPYIMGAGVKNIRNAVAYSEGNGAVSAIIPTKCLWTYAGVLLDQNNNALPASAETVNLSSLSSFMAIRATGAGYVDVSVCNIPSIDCTTTNAVVALVDESGKVLAKQTLDNRADDGADYRYCFPEHEFCVNESHTSEFDYKSAPVYYWLKSYVSEPGNVYVVFDRNGDGGGMIRVVHMQFTEEGSTSTGFNTEFNSYKAGSSQNFVGLSYSDVSSAAWYKVSATDENGMPTDFEQVFDFSAKTDYAVGTDIQHIGNAIFWQETGLGNAGIFTTTESVTDDDGFAMRGSTAGFESNEDKIISDLRVFGQFLMITASKGQKAVASLKYYCDSDIASNSVVALIDTTGKVIAIEEPQQDGSFSLTGYVETTGNVYLIFAQNYNDDAVCVTSFAAN